MQNVPLGKKFIQISPTWLKAQCKELFELKRHWIDWNGIESVDLSSPSQNNNICWWPIDCNSFTHAHRSHWVHSQPTLLAQNRRVTCTAMSSPQVEYHETKKNVHNSIFIIFNFNQTSESAYLVRALNSALLMGVVNQNAYAFIKVVLKAKSISLFNYFLSFSRCSLCPPQIGTNGAHEVSQRWFHSNELHIQHCLPRCLPVN